MEKRSKLEKVRNGAKLTTSALIMYTDFIRVFERTIDSKTIV